MYKYQHITSATKTKMKDEGAVLDCKDTKKLKNGKILAN